MEESRQLEASSSGVRMRWEDGVVYGLILAGIYFLVGVLFFYSGKEKIFDGIGALAIGQDVAGEHEGVASLFLYAGATGVLLALVLLMPPYRPGNWISGRGG